MSKTKRFFIETAKSVGYTVLGAGVLVGAVNISKYPAMLNGLLVLAIAYLIGVFLRSCFEKDTGIQVTVTYDNDTPKVQRSPARDQ